MIDDVEPLFAAGIIDCRNVDDVDEAAGGIVAQEFDDFDNLLGLNVHRKLIERNGMGNRGTRKRANNRLPQGVELAVVHYSKP